MDDDTLPTTVRSSGTRRHRARRVPSSCYAITKRNAALNNHHFKWTLPTSGLSWRWNSTAPLPPRSLPFASALCAVGRTKTGAYPRTVRMPPCHRLLRAVTMPRTRGIMSSLEEWLARGLSSREPAPPLRVAYRALASDGWLRRSWTDCRRVGSLLVRVLTISNPKHV